MRSRTQQANQLHVVGGCMHSTIAQPSVRMDSLSLPRVSLAAAAASAQPTTPTLPLCLPCTLPLPQHTNTQVLGPDVEYIISRAQTIQAGADSPVLTSEHLQRAIASLPGGGGPGGPGDPGLTKEDLEATMKQMLMVSGARLDSGLTPADAASAAAAAAVSVWRLCFQLTQVRLFQQTRATLHARPSPVCCRQHPYP